jgi:hypothetical protein
MAVFLLSKNTANKKLQAKAAAKVNNTIFKVLGLSDHIEALAGSTVNNTGGLYEIANSYSPIIFL